MSALVDFVFSVGGLLTALVPGLLWLSFRPASPGARRFLFGLVLAYLLASIYVVPYSMGRILALGFREFTAVDVPPGTTAIVLLGGGGITVRDWRQEGFSVLGPVGAARTLEAFRISRLLPYAPIVSSGGATRSLGLQQSDAVMMRDALVQLGVPSSRIILETESRDTHDEAVRIAPMVRSLNVGHVVLVTSDIHMRRALGAFRAQGVTSVPAIARDPFVSLPWRRRILPSQHGIESAGAVAHELLGIGYYAARGWLRVSP